MATWGAYFSSYVKKKDQNLIPHVEAVSDKPSQFTIKPYKAELNSGPSQDSFGLRRSDTRTKKLYFSPAESTTSVNELPQRSDSNAARVAKLFGYANPAPASALASVISDAVTAAQAESNSEEKIQSTLARPSSLILAEVKAAQATRAELETEGKVQFPPTAQIIVDKVPSTPPIAAKTEQPVHIENPARQSPIVNGRVKTMKASKPSISSLDEVMNMLENEAIVPSPARGSSQRNKESALLREAVGRRAGKESKAPKPSISSLDEMMSMLEQDWDIGWSDTRDSVSGENFTSSPVVELDSNSTQSYTQAPEKILITMKYVEEPEDLRIDTTANVSAYRKDSFTSSVSSYRGDLFTSPASSYRSNSFTSPISTYSKDSFAPPKLKSKSVVDLLEDTQGYMEEEGNEPTEKPILDCIQEAENMRLERERMEYERQKFQDEELAFKREADRFAKEEEQMRRFVEDMANEKELELENQERKRRKEEEKRRAEEAERKRLEEEEAERAAIEIAERLNTENERIEREVKQRKEREAKLYREMVDLERQRYVEEEARLREQRMEEQRMEENRREEQLKFEAEEKEEKKNSERKRRVEDIERARLAEEEAQRIEDERFQAEQRRAAKEKAAQQRESQRKEDERIAQEQRRVEKQKEERMRRYQDQQEAQRREAELQRQRYDEEDSEPEELTPEQKMAKAEQKIRAAFAGLAEERDQLAKGVKPAGRGPRVETGGSYAAAASERGVSRFNTVGGGPRSRQENPRGITRGNTVAMRPANKSTGGGLPSGPKGGFGLPGGPRAGLPSGPRPRR